MSYQIKGTVHDLKNESGTSKKGNDWNKTTVVVDTGSKYGNLVPVVFFNEPVDVNKGDQVTIDFYVNGREYSGNYYVDLSGDKLTVDGSSNTKSQEEVFESEGDDDSTLPF